LYSFCVVCSFIVCVVLCAVFRLIVVLFCVMCVICVLCLIVNHCHRVKTHLQLINITLHYIITLLFDTIFIHSFIHSFIQQWLYSLLLRPSRFFSFVILYTVGRNPWTGDQPVARPLRAHRHSCLEWDSDLLKAA
jgi:hypothetical protein